MAKDIKLYKFKHKGAEFNFKAHSMEDAFSKYMNFTQKTKDLPKWLVYG